jgi:ribosomal protein S18 acetylase RimI-like enzyme
MDTAARARLRPARLADAASLGRVESRAWRIAYADLLPAPLLDRLVPGRLADRWQARIGRGDPILVWSEPEIGAVAYATFGPAREGSYEPGFAGELFELYVHPEFQRRGIGRHLVEAVQAALRTRHPWFVVEVLRDNAPARAFYAAIGLQTDDRVVRRPLNGSLTSGRRYSVPLATVPVVRYEGPLVPIGW